MKDLQHTKGEWRFRRNADYIGNKKAGEHTEIYTNPQNEAKNHINVICRLEDRFYDGGDTDPIYSQDRTNHIANAKLIAAAPELLKALSEVKDLLDQEFQTKDQLIPQPIVNAYNTIEQVVKKAIEQ